MRWWPLFLVACGDASGPRGRAQGDPEAGPQLEHLPSEAPELGTTTVPLLGDALAETCTPTSRGDLSPGSLHRVTLDIAGRCNDGTAPALYIRGARDPALADRWIMHLEGGSWCADWASCQVRWCGTGMYHAGKMSTAWAGETRRAAGWMSEEPGHALADVNVVYFKYCSSDAWLGTRGDHVFEGPDGEPDYRLHFEGHTILEGAIAALEQGVVSDDGEETLPPLADASHVLFGGQSAGALGVVMHLDWLAARLAPVEVRGVVDSILYPHVEFFDVPGLEDHVAAALKASWNDDMLADYDAFIDESCLEDEAEDERWRCLDMGRVQRDHVATPFLVNQSIQDKVIDDFYLDAGATRDAFAEATEATLRSWATLRPELSLRGIGCKKHAQLANDDWYRRAIVSDEYGRRWRLSGAIAAFEAGDRVVVIDDAVGDRSVCEPP